MDKYRKYKTAIWILSFIIVIQGIFMVIISRPKKIPKVVPAIKGKIAIVIDDWGYNLHNLAILDGIKYPLTISVLPNLNYSQTISKELHQRGFEIILHLPLEPREKFRLEKDTVMTSMDTQAIRNIIARDLTSVAHAKGVSNHMGSRATEDLKTMETILRELKRRRLYFLDSVVSSESLGFDLAHKMHILFARRDIFLDNKQEPEYIRMQIHKLKTRAQVYGQAIGIGHDQKVTLEVLKEAMPQLAREGYKFVFVSELVK